MKEIWITHLFLHLLVPVIVILNYIILSYEKFELKVVIAIIIGSFLPDIDHIIYYKYVPLNLVEFIKFNIKSDRFRRGFLVFHNIPFLIFWAILTPLTAIYSLNVFLFFLSFLLHLLLDYLDDKFVLGYTYHWKKVKLSRGPVV